MLGEPTVLLTYKRPKGHYYLGYRRVAVEADIMVDTKELIWVNEGVSMWRRSVAIRFNAVLSSTTTQSAFKVNLFKVSKELYGCTTTSLRVQHTKHCEDMLANIVCLSLLIPRFSQVREYTVSLYQLLRITL